MEYERRTSGGVTYLVRKRSARQNGIRMQDEHGRFYYSATEKTRASGNMIILYLWFQREDKEVGTIVFSKQWIHGSNNFPHMGPKKWQKFLEENLDSLIAHAIRVYNREYATKSVQLVMFEGWRITKKKVINLSDCNYYPTTPSVRTKLTEEQFAKLKWNES